MNGDHQTPVKVIAKFNFEGRNNDELTFRKNDVITVTQQLDGGWWEGSLDGVVGWFPSDFVGLVKTQSAAPATNGNVGHDEPDNAQSLENKKIEFRKSVVQDFLKKEEEHIGELEKVNRLILPMIFETKLFTPEEKRDINSNLAEIIETKQSIFEQLKATVERPFFEQRIGDVFLKEAAGLKTLLQIYCWNHPYAIWTVTKKSKKEDENTERQKKINELLKKENLAYKDLIAGLSLPFRHTERYATSLLEVERNTVSSHPDLGNLQRACAVYRNISEDCLSLRKQKELQLEFLHSGFLEKAVGKDYEVKLGPMIHFTSVTVTQPNSQEADSVLDRSIVLCSKACLLLEPLIEKNTYVLKEKLTTSGLKVLADENTLKLKFMKDDAPILIVSCLSANDFHRFSIALQQCPSLEFASDDSSNFAVQEIPPTSPQHLRTVSQQPIRPEVQQAPVPSSVQHKPDYAGDFKLNHDLEMILPEGLSGPPSNRSSSQKPPVPAHPNNNGNNTPRPQRMAKLYSGWSLRPIPPQRPEGVLQTSTSASSIKMRKGLTAEEQDDAYLLKIVEGYFGATPMANVSKSFSKLNMNSSSSLPKRTPSYSNPEDMIRPQVIVAGEEKILIEEQDGDAVVFKEKTLVDTVYDLSGSVTALRKEVATLTRTLDKEQKARRRLEEAIRRQSNQFSQTSSPKPSFDMVESTSS